MIYALKTRDVSDHERRLIARALRDDKAFPAELDKKIIHVCDTKVGDNRYFCIYCLGKVHKWYYRKSVSFHHGTGIGKGCLGGDNGIPGIENPLGATTTCP